MKYNHNVLNFIGLLALITLTSACEEVNPPSEDTIRMKFNSTSLQIPKELVIDRLPSTIVTGKGLDSESNGVSLKIPLKHIDRQEIDSTSLLGNVIILIASSNNMEKSDDVKNALSGDGVYKERIIVRDPIVNLYRVYARSGYPKIWHYIKSDSQLIDQSSHWIGSCTVGPFEDEKHDLQNVKCNSKASYKDIVFQYTTNAKYFDQSYKLESFIIKTIKAWDESQRRI